MAVMVCHRLTAQWKIFVNFSDFIFTLAVLVFGIEHKCHIFRQTIVITTAFSISEKIKRNLPTILSVKLQNIGKLRLQFGRCVKAS